MFEQDKVAWAQEQARGRPATGPMQGAVYDESYGEVWFSCGGERFCVLELRTASDHNREQAAEKLAARMTGRLR